MGNNRPHDASRHFHALREAKEDLPGLLLMDRVQRGNTSDEPGLKKIMWRQREIENYLCHREALISFAGEEKENDLFMSAEKNKRIKIMKKEIDEMEAALKKLNKPKAFSKNIKASDDFLVPLFTNFYKKISPCSTDVSPQILAKKDFHILVKYLSVNEIDEEVKEKLDAILEIATKAKICND